MGFGCQVQIADEQGRAILLKPFALEDMRHLLPGMQYHSNLKWLGRSFAQTLESEQAWYERMSSSETDVLFGVFVDDVPVGSFGLHGMRDRRATAGAVMFSNDHQSARIGTSVTRAGLYYATQVLDIIAIDASVKSSNQRSHRMQESAGFVTTGRIVNSQFVDGRQCDLLNLLWVNPERYAWNYFWRGANPGKPFQGARARARHVLAWAEENVVFL